MSKSRDRPVILDRDPEGIGLGLPLVNLPEYKTQHRKKQAKRSIQTWNMMGADTETLGGKCWLFSTEKGVWETPTLSHLISILYNPSHARKWRKSGRSGYRVPEFFFWNLKFDAQAVMRLMTEEVILSLIGSRDEEEEIGSNKVIVNADTGDFQPEVSGRMVEFRYLEGKHLSITPINWRRGRAKLGPCKWWDISQYYNKMKLNTASKIYLGKTKLEKCFDGSVLDASRFDETDYRDMYREDIEKYAIIDAVLCGELARRKRNEFVQSGVRFIQPYSLANSAQRSLLDTSMIPTMNSLGLHKIVQQSLSAYRGGWFETVGSGYWKDATGVDLASAYPYVMYHLDDFTEEGAAWICGDGGEEFMDWMNVRVPYSIGFCEITMLFENGLPWHPLARMSPTGTIVTPRFVRGWFTADEIAEALKWPHTNFILGRWFYLLPGTEGNKPFRPFIERFYEMKMNSAKGSSEYAVSKVMLNSIYGKTIQAINGKTGKLWNPFYAAVTTGGTRARLAELVRMNGFSALSVATDGVIFPSDKLRIIPNRPLPAPHNLGQWEMEEQGELALLMSGVYSMRTEEGIKTTFRGSASLFLRGSNLFDFCEERAGDTHASTTIRRPYSAGEARIRGDMTLMNVFRPCDFTIQPAGDSTKRLWGIEKPEYFGDLLSQWWTSLPHQRIQEPPSIG